MSGRATDRSKSGALPGSRLSSGWSIHTGDGSVDLSVPNNLQANIDAHTNDGISALIFPFRWKARAPHCASGKIEWRRRIAQHLDRRWLDPRPPIMITFLCEVFGGLCTVDQLELLNSTPTKSEHDTPLGYVDREL